MPEVITQRTPGVWLQAISDLLMGIAKLTLQAIWLFCCGWAFAEIVILRSKRKTFPTRLAVGLGTAKLFKAVTGGKR